jgi:heme exporter protein C
MWGSMFRWLDPYAKPETLYHLCGRLLPYLMGLAVFTLLLGNIWGLAFSPSDYQQGDSYRIIYIHVPSAIWSMGAYSSMAIAAFIGLVWQIRVAQWAVLAIAPIGAVYTVIALFTGAAWGKPMWGTWWVWDARLTSELVLLFLYLGVIALAGAFSEAARGIKVASLLAIVGVVNLPIIHYSVEWWNTLHQGATITKFAKPSIDPSMLWPLLISILGFALLLAALTCLRLRSQILIFEQHRPWVRQLVDSMAASSQKEQN